MRSRSPSRRRITPDAALPRIDTTAGDAQVMARLQRYCDQLLSDGRRMSPEGREAFEPLFAALQEPPTPGRDAAIAALDTLSYELRSERFARDRTAQNCLVGALAICPPRSGELAQAIAAMEAFVAKVGAEQLLPSTTSAYLLALVNRAAVIRSRLRYLAGHIRRRYTIVRARSNHVLGRHLGVEHRPQKDVLAQAVLEDEMARLEQERPFEAAERFLADFLPALKVRWSTLDEVRKQAAYFGRVEVVKALNRRLKGHGRVGTTAEAIFHLALAHDRAGNHTQVLEQWRLACEAPYPMMASSGSRPTASAALPYAPTLRSRVEVGSDEDATWRSRRPKMALGPAASLASMAMRAFCALGRDAEADRLMREPPGWLVEQVGESITIQLRMNMANACASRDQLETAVREHAQAYDDAEAMLADMPAESPRRAELLGLLSLSTRALIYHIDQGDLEKVSTEMTSGLDGDVRPFLVVINTLVAITERLLASPDVQYRRAEVVLLVVRVRARCHI